MGNQAGEYRTGSLQRTAGAIRLPRWRSPLVVPNGERFHRTKQQCSQDGADNTGYRPAVKQTAEPAHKRTEYGTVPWAGEKWARLFAWRDLGHASQCNALQCAGYACGMGLLEVAAIACALFTAAIFLATYKKRDRAMAVLIGASAGLVGAQVMKVHIFTILVVVWCLIPREGANKGWDKKATLLMLCSAILAATALIGDLTVSPTLALQLLALTGSASILIYRGTRQDRTDILYGLFAIASLSSILGVLQVAKVVPIEIWHVHVSSLGRPIGLYSEPDWLGLFSGLALILAWRLPMPAPLRTLCILVNGAAFVFAFARAAWLGVAVAVALAIAANIVTKKRETLAIPGKGRWPALVILGVVGAAFLAVNPAFAQDFSTRLQGTVSVSQADISGQARVRQIDGLMEMAETAPWYGHGLSANGRVGVFGGVNTGDAGDSSNAVNSNWVLAMWVDGKLLALPIMALLIVVALKACRSLPGQLLVMVLVNSLFSNATFQPITWLLGALAFTISSDRKESLPVIESATKSLRPTPSRGQQ